MPYSKSRARKEFEIEVNKLLKLAKKVSYKSSPLTYGHKQLVNQSCIFLLSARIEDFTKNLIEDLLYSYRSKGATLNAIPRNIRTKTLLDRQVNFYRSYYNSSDERSLLKSISIDSPYYGIIDNAANFTNQVFPTNIIGTNKYPSIKNLQILYFRVGINNIISDLNRKARKDIKTNIESFLSLREAIAHQGAPAVTFNDVERHFKNMVEAINYLDRVVYSHIRKESGDKYWS
ncbi:HEPN domain-containing protein [Chitinophaga sp.]|uniref:HEPN domain-containing protein n=1 Tax=Chitinophaga sp. TaxID=1869181 RepID=UPI0031D0682C